MAREERKPSASESMNGSVFSPRFKSVAAMAGWDEESLLYASLIVDDTPDRNLSHKKRTVIQFKTPPTTDSRKKRRAQSSPVVPIPIVALDLGDVEASKNVETQNDSPKAGKKEREKEKGDIVEDKISGDSTSLPCMDKLREELSCAICLDICFEPSTTPCGHSFCLKCLRFSASKCGKKCPKCRQLISNGRACTVNTVLWNTIQLLFPQEVEAKKAVGSSNSRQSEGPRKISETSFYDNLRNERRSDESALPRSSEETSTRRRRSTQSQNEDPTASLEREIRRNIRASSRVSSRDIRARVGRTRPSQDEDAALALRLQREEFMEAVNGTSSTIQTRTINPNSTRSNNSQALNQSSISPNSTTYSNSVTSFSSARANLRAMASRATTLRIRRHF